MNEVLQEIVDIVKQAPRLYFAPLVGAARGIREEYARIEAEDIARKAARSKAKQSPTHN